MTTDDILQRLEGVRPRGAGRWVSRCPSHNDHTPSLSVSEGDRGLLIRCWAGCELSAICEAIGVKPKDLFYDAGGPVDRDAIRRNQNRRRAAQARKRASGKRADAFREAETVIRAATNLDISEWSDEQLDAAMNAVCDARALLEREETDAARHDPISA